MVVLFGSKSFCLRWPESEDWEICGQGADFAWMQIAEPVMRSYTESTDGSYIEAKESALVWHHQDADPDFGSAQAKEMLDHLESVLANEPVAVKKGQFIVEVKPQVCFVHKSTFPPFLCSSCTKQMEVGCASSGIPLRGDVLFLALPLSDTFLYFEMHVD